MAVEEGKRGGRNPPIIEKRRAFAKQHLTYEVEMIINTTRLMGSNGDRVGKIRKKAHASRTDEKRALLVEFNALLESWAIHNRLLHEFLFPTRDSKTGRPPPNGNRGYPDTAAAEDFVTNHDLWARKHVGKRNRSPGFEETNKRIAHLTYQRLVPQTSGWDLDYAVRTVRMMRDMLLNADPSMFDIETMEALTSLTDQFIR